jgi:hypothetical protein
LKRKWLFSILAVVAATLFSLNAAAQATPESGTAGTPATPQYKWKAFVGFGYTSLNQVNQSRYGLVGVDAAVTRNWGRYFGLTANGSAYPGALQSGNPGNPSVQMVLFGPEVHGHIFDKLSVFGHALIGGAHTGGEQMTPKVSFAGGGGGGMEYELSPRWGIRAYGDSIASAFSVTNNSPALGNSPHTRRNARASIGVTYSF